MNSVYVKEFISNVVKNANVSSSDLRNDARSNRNTVAFEKWDLVLSQNRCFFSYSVKIKYENQQLNIFLLDSDKQSFSLDNVLKLIKINAVIVK